MSRLSLILFAIGLAAVPAAGQPPRPATDAVTVRLESPTTRKRLAEAQEKIRAGKADEALKELQEILDGAGDDLVAPAPNGRLVPARRIAFALIASLPPATLKSYQSRVQSAAIALLTAAKQSRDPAPLEDLLTRYFPSRVTPDALTLLGDLQLERGEFTAAERTYARLVPQADRVGWNVSDAPANPAAVAARLALARVLQADAELTVMTLDEFEKAHPKATGELAGRKGLFLETLKTVAASAKPIPAYGPHGSWATVGGNPARSGRVDSRLPSAWPSGPTWKTPIPPAGDRLDFRSRVEIVTKSAANHPVIANGAAYLADAGRIMTFDLATGKAEVAFDLRGDERFTSFGESDLAVPPRFDADLTLTASDGHLYARLGTPALWTANGNENAPKPVSLLMRFTPVGGRLKPDWRVVPPGPAGASWEGTPIIADGRVIAATARADGGRVIHSLVCYDHASPDPLWAVDVADSPLPSGSPRTRHELVTLADGLAIFNTNAGSVVAVNAATGKPAWAVTYASQKPSGRALVPASAANHRDLAPAVVHDGTAYVAPNDGEVIFAIDTASGAILWEKAGLRVESLLGVTAGKLIATIAGPVRGVRAFDARTGSDEFPLGWRNHDDPGLASLGRGLVSDEHILWPTRAGLISLRPGDGRLARPPVPGPHGNLAYAGGVLVVANPTEVLGYVIPETWRTPRPPAPASSPPPRIAIIEPPTIAAAPPKKQPVLPPLAPKAITKTIDVPGTAGVLPSDAAAGLWFVNGSTATPVSADGQIGVRLELPFTPTAVFGIGGKARAFTDGESVHRPDTKGTFSVRELHDDTEPLGPLHINYGLIAALVGRHHLVALDAVSLRPKWVIDASGRPGYWPFRPASAPRFGPNLLITPSGVVTQTDDGKVTVFDTGTGAARFSRATTKTDWAVPPALVGEDASEAVVIPGGPGHVVRLDPLEGEFRWGSRHDNESGLTGQSPAAIVRGEKLFVATSRNHGIEIQFVDEETGRSKWRRPITIPGTTTDILAIDCDGSNLFVPHGETITCIRLIDGRPIWATPAARGRGSVRVIAAVGGPLVVPIEPVARADEHGEYVVHSLTRFPDPRRAVGLLATLAEPWADRHLPIRVLDANTGATKATIDIPVTGPAAVARFSPRGGVVATAGRVYLLK